MLSSAKIAMIPIRYKVKHHVNTLGDKGGKGAMGQNLSNLAVDNRDGAAYQR